MLKLNLYHYLDMKVPISGYEMLVIKKWFILKEVFFTGPSVPLLFFFLSDVNISQHNTAVSTVYILTTAEPEAHHLQHVLDWSCSHLD